MSKIIFLDRNAIISIEKIIQKKQVPAQQAQQLKALDKKNNIISSFFSSIEGKSGISELPRQMNPTFVEEAILLSSFFKKAQTDGVAIMMLRQLFSTFGEKDTFATKELLKFIVEVNTILKNKISKIKQKEKFSEILKIAAELCIPQGHPVVICAISTLYGSDNSRSILKPNSKDPQKGAYNALCDIQLIIFVARLELIRNTLGKTHIPFKIFSFDKALANFLSAIKINNSCYTPGSLDCEMTHNFTYSNELFPDLKDEALGEMYEELKRI